MYFSYTLFGVGRKYETDKSSDELVHNKQQKLIANKFRNCFIGSETGTNGNDYFNVIALGHGTTATAASQVTVGNPASSSYKVFNNWANISDGPNDVYALKHAGFVVPLVKAVQELSAKNDEKDRIISSLEVRLARVQVDARILSSGAYNYSLFIDNMLISSKKMIRGK